jgi:hypothetical protein
MPQALQLVVVAVHAKALSLLYVDQLLEDVKQVSFTELFGSTPMYQGNSGSAACQAWNQFRRCF